MQMISVDLQLFGKNSMCLLITVADIDETCTNSLLFEVLVYIFTAEASRCGKAMVCVDCIMNIFENDELYKVCLHT